MKAIDLIVKVLPKISENIGNLHKAVEILKFSSKLTASKQKDWIDLNVGGQLFTTSKCAILSVPKSIFTLMLEAESLEKQKEIQDLDEFEKEAIQKKMNKWGKKGEVYLFDRDPEYFSIILCYLRTGKLVYNDGVSLEGIKEEAKFYELHGLEREIRKAIYARQLAEKRKSNKE